MEQASLAHHDDGSEMREERDGHNAVTLSSHTNDPSVSWLVADDYTDALIHLAWHADMDTGVRTLIFGLVELFPSELSRPTSIAECHLSIKILKQQAGRTRKRRERVYVERFCLPLRAALIWYDTCRAGRVTFPVDDASGGQDVELAHTPFAEEPRWPHLVTTRDRPFLSANWGTVRAHHLHQTRALAIISLIMTNDEAASRTRLSP